MFLEEMEKKRAKRLEIIEKHVNNGVKFVDEFQAYIDETVVIGAGTLIGPCVTLEGETVIGENCFIGQNTVIKDSKIDDNVNIEVKNSTMGDGAKASHLTYIGDSDVGAKVNLGCGVVFVNYDGTKKYRSVVEDGAFIGCNSNLVSPVRVGQGAYIAACSTVTEDVEGDALFIARAKGTQKPEWVSAKGILKKK